MKEYRIQIILKNGHPINLDYLSHLERNAVVGKIKKDYKERSYIEVHNEDLNYFIPKDSIAYILYNTSRLTDMTKVENDSTD